MSEYGGYNGGSQWTGAAPAAPMNADQAQRQFAQFQNQSAQALNSVVSVQEKNGKIYWLGLEVPKEAAPVLQYVTSVMPTFVGGAMGGAIYDQTTNIFNRINTKFALGKTPLAAHKAGLAAAAAFTGALIGVQPITEIVHVVGARSKERKALRESVASILELDHGAMKTNEVLLTANERTQGNMTEGLKHVAADLPTILLNGYFAFGDHKGLRRDKNARFDAHQVNAAVEGSASAAASARVARNAAEAKDKEEFLKAHAGQDSVWEEIIQERRQSEEVKRRASAEASFRSTGNETMDSLKRDSTKGLVIPVAGLASSLLKQNLVKQTDNEKSKGCAYELIVALKKSVEEGHASPSSVASKVVEIFQRNELDRGRATVGPALMEKFQPLADRIGEVIANGELDALALVNLVGNGHVLNKRRFVKAERLEELLDEQRKLFGSHEKTPLDEFLADFQNPTMIMQAIKQNLQTLQGNERAVFASLFSDDVLLHAGINKPEILTLRTQGHDFMYEFVRTATLELAKKTPEQLEKEGLSEKQIDAINALNETLVNADAKEVTAKVKAVVDGGDPVLSAVRNARLTEQLANPAGARKAWRDLVHKAPKAPAEVAKEKAADKGDKEGKTHAECVQPKEKHLDKVSEGGKTASERVERRREDEKSNGIGGVV